MSTPFNQAAPSFPTVINTSNCLVFGNTVSTALSVRQFGTGPVMNVANAAGTSALYVDPMGKIGVNTTSPGTALQVSGTVLTTGLAVIQPPVLPFTQAAFFGWNRAGAIVNGSTAFMNQQGGGSGGWEFINYDNSNQLSSNCAFISSAGGLTLGTYSNVTVAPNGGIICPGNVGIGISAVSAKLQIFGGASSTTTNGAPGTGGVIIGSDATNGNAGDMSPVLHFRQSWYTQGSGSVSTGGIAGYKTVGSGSFGGGLSFMYCANGATSLTQGITLTDLGRVGINTTSPGNMLQVAGTASTLSVGGAAGWSNVVQLGNVSYNQYGTASAYPVDRFTIVTSGLPGVNDLYNGNGGLYVASQGLRLAGQRLLWGGPTTSYESSIEIDGGRSALAGVNHGQIRFYTAGTQRAVIDEGGKVGIGTTTPGSLLQIGPGGQSFSTAQNTGTKTQYDAGVNIFNGIAYFSGFLQVFVNYNSYDRTAALLYHFCACKNVTGGNIVVSSTLINSAITASADFNANCAFSPASGTTFNILLQTSGTRSGASSLTYSATISGVSG